jgi:dienelactone hydrolase
MVASADSTEASTAAPRTLALVVAAVVASQSALCGYTASAPPRFGIVGYGSGGIVALLAACRCQFGVAITFYGDGPRTLRANLSQILDGPKSHAARVVCFLGTEDRRVRPEDVRILRERFHACELRHSFVVYPKVADGFCRPRTLTYRGAVADDAWSKLIHALETAHRPRHRFRAKPRAVRPPEA